MPADASTFVTPSVTPSVAPSLRPAAPGSGTASASGPGPGNAAAVADAGLGPARASSAMEDAIGILGNAAGSLLDLVPLAAAVPLALAHREAMWAASWLGARPLSRLAALGRDIFGAVLDYVWPTGHAIEVGGDATVAAGPTVGLGDGARLERRVNGWVVTLRDLGTVAMTEGMNASILMARGEPLAAVGLEAGVGATVRVTRSWGTPLEQAGADQLTLDDVGGERPALLHWFVRLVHTAAAMCGRPTEARFELMGGGQGSAIAGGEGGGAWGAAEGSVAGWGAMGWEGDLGYAELSLGPSLSARGGGVTLRLLAGWFGVPQGALTQADAEGSTVRVEGDLSRIANGDCEGARFRCTRSDTVGGVQTSDCFTTRDPRAAGSWLLGRAGDALVPGGDAPAAVPVTVPAADLPDLTLTRSLSRRIDDEAQQQAALPALTRFAEQTLPSHFFFVGFRGLVLSGTVAIDRDVVRAALGGQSVPEASCPEDAFLQVARHLAAALVGGSAPRLGIDLDLGAAMAGLAVRNPELVATATFAAGGGFDIEEILKVGLAANAQVVIEVRVPLAAETPDQLRARFLGG